MSQNRNVEIEIIDGKLYGSKMSDEWHRRYAGQDIAVVTFDMPESSNGFSKLTFVVTGKGVIPSMMIF